jgi:hypothetical protein
VGPLEKKRLMPSPPLLLHAGGKEELMAEPSCLTNFAISAAHIPRSPMMKYGLPIKYISLYF